jgi:hypothetical protein
MPDLTRWLRLEIGCQPNDVDRLSRNFDIKLHKDN